jgi:hypothetical protein
MKRLADNKTTLPYLTHKPTSDMPKHEQKVVIEYVEAKLIK